MFFVFVLVVRSFLRDFITHFEHIIRERERELVREITSSFHRQGCAEEYIRQTLFTHVSVSRDDDDDDDS